MRKPLRYRAGNHTWVLKGCGVVNTWGCMEEGHGGVMTSKT